MGCSSRFGVNPPALDVADDGALARHKAGQGMGTARRAHALPQSQHCDFRRQGPHLVHRTERHLWPAQSDGRRYECLGRTEVSRTLRERAAFGRIRKADYGSVSGTPATLASTIRPTMEAME